MGTQRAMRSGGGHESVAEEHDAGSSRDEPLVAGC
jgi:hypothetical protein